MLSWSAVQGQWPNASFSRFVPSQAIDWHVQVGGTGPVVLLLHGTGAASFSWGDLFPLLLPHYTVVVPDLPGHGFTSAPRRELLTLSGMAAACGGLLTTLGLEPAAVVGHSAGAAILLQMALDQRIDPALIVGLNPALMPPPLLYRALVAPLAHRVAAMGIVAAAAAALAQQDGIVDSLLRATRSDISPRQAALYRLLFRSRQHDQQVLTMMATWSLTELADRLGQVRPRVELITGTRDPWIVTADLARLVRRMPDASLTEEPGGHLLHEEHPAPIAGLLHHRISSALPR